MWSLYWLLPFYQSLFGTWHGFWNRIAEPEPAKLCNSNHESFGNLMDMSTFLYRSPSRRVVDVKIPLQNLVENSAIQLPDDISKSSLPGFYDPCPGCEKSLKVSYQWNFFYSTVVKFTMSHQVCYKFRNRRHEVLIGDKEKLRMPLKSKFVILASTLIQSTNSHIL